jgi:hypothetical protein
MEPARSEGSPPTHDAVLIALGASAWPFPRREARSAARPELERATLDVLAATARAWGLAGRVPATRRAR